MKSFSAAPSSHSERRSPVRPYAGASETKEKLRNVGRPTRRVLHWPICYWRKATVASRQKCFLKKRIIVMMFRVVSIEI